MKHSENNLIFALKNGALVSIKDVESGLACGCVCPACGDVLVARKGDKRIHHFAHRSGSNCEYGYETSLHLAAKEILSKSAKMIIPDVYVDFDSYKCAELLSESCEIAIDRVELEKRFGDIIPDIVLYSGGKKLFVEIYVTHKIDDIKREKIIEANISTIEIDLSNINTLINESDLEEILINGVEYKKWIYNSYATKRKTKFLNSSQKLKITEKQKFGRKYLDVYGCPISMREWKGKSYAIYDEDCVRCRYHVGNYDGGIFCTGKQRIATASDFDIPFEQRKKEHDDINDTLKEHAYVARYGRTPTNNSVNVDEEEINDEIKELFDLDISKISTQKLWSDPFLYTHRFGIEQYDSEIEKRYRAETKKLSDAKNRVDKENYSIGYDEVREKFDQQSEPIFDSNGQRWIKCIVCGEIKVDRYFASYGGINPNLGTCSECSRRQK